MINIFRFLNQCVRPQRCFLIPPNHALLTNILGKKFKLLSWFTEVHGIGDATRLSLSLNTSDKDRDYQFYQNISSGLPLEELQPFWFDYFHLIFFLCQQVINLTLMSVKA